MFHHLPAEEKSPMLGEVRRVLKPGGQFLMLDFEAPEEGGHGFLARLFHSRERLKDNSEARVLARMSQAGFLTAEKIARRRMLFGAIAYYRASA
jgi:ubiquinone/menaquinone biosynthesis C-methylase UbiE